MLWRTHFRGFVINVIGNCTFLLCTLPNLLFFYVISKCAIFTIWILFSIFFNLLGLVTIYFNGVYFIHFSLLRLNISLGENLNWWNIWLQFYCEFISVQNHSGLYYGQTIHSPLPHPYFSRHSFFSLYNFVWKELT